MREKMLAIGFLAYVLKFVTDNKYRMLSDCVKPFGIGDTYTYDELYDMYSGQPAHKKVDLGTGTKVGELRFQS